MNYTTNDYFKEAEIPEILHKLCQHLAPRRKDVAYRLAIRGLSEYGSSMMPMDETAVCLRVKQRIQSLRSDVEADMFDRLYEILQTTKMIKNRYSVLTFLSVLSLQSENKMPTSISCESNRAPFCSSRQDENMMSLVPLTSKSSFEVQKLYQARSTPSRANSGMSGLNLIHTTTSTNSSSRASCVIDQKVFDIIPADVSEDILIQEVVYCFQGIEGQHLRREAGGGFYLDPRSRIRRPQARLVLRLAELGYLHDKVKQYVDPLSGKAPLGLMGQGLVSEIRAELTEYYRMVTILHEQIKRQSDQSEVSLMGNTSGGAVTLMKLACWVVDPMHRLRWLSTIAEACEGKKGGALASTIYQFLWNGDPKVSALVVQLLGAACGPLYTMVTGWLLDGEIKDPSGEFFIEALPNVTGDRLWHEKYRVRLNMLPTFLSLEQARRILSTGKCINFLREVCQDSQPLHGREALKRVLENSNVQALFGQCRESNLHTVMDTAYRDASKRVLDTLMGKHKLLSHLQALRRYLLLGQGDFIRHLMELLSPELAKPGSQLFKHNLNSMLESAIRATNAQFDDIDILNRLDVKLIESSDGDTGWDIFSLQYHVEGPIGTVFEPAEDHYLVLFNNLWQAKRMEFILSHLWKDQMTSAKLICSLKELRIVTQQLHILTAEMVHFVHQMQYYILFEVLECSWADLIEKVHRAESLDDILVAHESFLKTVETGALLRSSSAGDNLANKLAAVYNPILELQTLQQAIYSRAQVEQKDRMEYRARVKQSAKEGTYGTNTELRLKRDQDRKDFIHFLDNQKQKINGIGNGYQKYCKDFLLVLSLTNNVNLQLLSNRLDFNGYYKKADLRLNAPLTYQHRRMSQMQASSNMTRSYVTTRKK